MEGNKQQEFSVDLLKIYYGRLFPYDAMYNWISYGNIVNDMENPVVDKDYFPKREWSFTIEDDIYIRYQSFRDKAELIAAIQKRQPHKIDIGAVFSHYPKDHTVVKADLFKPVERELVFDIDMTDYDDIRKCCTGANICRKCWPYMTMAVKVLDKTLRDDFAFQNILWIYSGRRGVHCWVCDSQARTLPNEARSAIVEYMTVETGSSENSDRKNNNPFTKPYHPMIRRAYDILEPFFEAHIISADGQGLLATKLSYQEVLKSMPNLNVRANLNSAWEADPKMTALQRWQSLKNATTADTAHGSTQPNKKKNATSYTELVALEGWRMELIFTHCYPRLDADVSKSQNHLLKSPFCVHPKTGRVCVPIDPRVAEEFDPFAVPTLRTLCEEVDEYDRSAGEEAGAVPDWQKTSLRNSLRTFDETFMNGLKITIKRDFKDKQSQIDAMNVDF